MTHIPVQVKRAGYELPVPSTALTAEAELRTRGSTAILSFRYRERGYDRVGAIRFLKVRAFQHREEIHCTLFQIQNGYDTLVEVIASPWASEIVDDTNEKWRTTWVLKHFLIYFDSSGCYEFLCEAWEATDGVQAPGEC